ncbi:protein of unknown function [Rhodovastum atsumiense]|nr:protein of unknown function [Rhodovastum atsumiense]
MIVMDKIYALGLPGQIRIDVKLT